MAEARLPGEAPAPERPSDPDAPLEARLAVTTALHRTVLSRLLARRDLAERHIRRRYDDWTRTDEHCRLFIDLSRRARKADRTEDPAKAEMPFARAIVIPVALAILLVRLTQLMAIFTRREPMIELAGRGPEDVRPAKLMEALLAYDLAQTQAILTLHSFLQDAEKYGIGVIFDSWDEQPGWIVRPAPALPEPILRVMAGLGLPVGPRREWGTLWEGNRWEPVDPFRFWPDPRVPVGDPQQGEFIGHRVYRGWMHLKERAQPDGPYFNLDALRQGDAKGAGLGVGGRTSPPPPVQDFALHGSLDPSDRGFFALDHLQVKLIPREWQLGPEERPSVWWFTVADDAVIIRAHPAAYAHGRFTYSVGETLPDPHVAFNPGMIENLDGLQRVINWLANSHAENVRKHLNDAMLYAPSLIEEADLLNPGPARHVRITPKAEELLLQGRLGLGQMIQQLAVVDVTGQHLRTVQLLFDMAQRLAATSDPQMSQTTDDRRTLGEVQQILVASSQRLATVARLLDVQAIQPLVLRAVANRQQFTRLEQAVRITGDLAKELGGVTRLVVRPSDIAGNFDYVPISGVLPPDPAQMASTWIQILTAVLQAPALQQPRADGKVLDVHEIFAEAVRNAGVRHIEQFYRQIQVQPDQAVAAQVQAGTMVPLEAMAANGRVPGAGITGPIVPGADLNG